MLRWWRITIIGFLVALGAGLMPGRVPAAAVAVVTEGWSPVAPMGTARSGHTATTLPDGRVLVTGGLMQRNSVPTATAEVYDPIGDHWTPIAAMSVPRYSHKAVTLPDGRVLIVGNGAEIYDPASDRWQSTAPEPPGQILTSATLLPDGQVFVIGNYLAWRFDPRTDRWSALGGNGYLGQQSVTLLPSGKVLIAGGSRRLGAKLGSGWSNSAELYDPLTDHLVPTSSMLAVHVGHSALLLGDGRILVLGGGGPLAGGGPPELYDPVSSQWVLTAPPPLSRIGGAIVLNDGRVLAIGSDGAALYDPAGDHWSAVPGPRMPRGSGPLTPLRDGRVLLAGGLGTAFALSLNVAEAFGPLNLDPPRCFAETGFCIAGRFLDYWQANGGLARNGFPLTPERTELLEDGKEYTVQYFERLRLEYHPENAPPYDVLLGQFGRRIFTYRGGQLAPVAPLPGQRYFPETGHNLGGKFLDYWQQNGGLAQFGYPLSEEQIDYRIGGPSDSYLVQYFERARLEFHPEHAGTPYEVLLAQFGREILAEVDLLAGDFGRLYLTDERVRERLGRPRAAASQVAGAALAFEGGQMLWRGDTRLIHVLGGVGTRGTLVTDEYLRTIAFQDTWTEGQEPGGGPAPTAGLFLPPRGFGKIWRDGSSALDGRPPLPYVRDRLGYALTPVERGYTLTVQEFDHGLLLSDPEGRSITMIIDASAKCCIGGDYEQFAVR